MRIYIDRYSNIEHLR